MKRFKKLIVVTTIATVVIGAVAPQTRLPMISPFSATPILVMALFIQNPVLKLHTDP